jgi:CheY-like chemotaxis protein
MTTITEYAHFIVIDDEPFNNLICKKLTQTVYPEAEVKTFTDPEKGLSFLLSEFSKTTDSTTILFLDINMPNMNGWEFMVEYKRLSDDIKAKINLYILSSSVDPIDKEKAQQNPYILDFIEKPLTIERLKSL